MFAVYIHQLYSEASVPAFNFLHEAAVLLLSTPRFFLHLEKRKMFPGDYPASSSLTICNTKDLAAFDLGSANSLEPT